MGIHHSHHHNHPRKGRNVLAAFWLNSGFAVLELVGGYLTGSMAILTDALHDFGDSLSLGLAFYFEKKSGKQRDRNYSYGYRRFTLLGALINALVLVAGSVFIIRESIVRLGNPAQPDARGMFVLALIGIAVNAAAMWRLRQGDSLSERVVSLHFLEDVLGWVAVLVGSIIMWFADVPILDPVLSLLIAGYILFNVYRNLRQAFRIILQGIPENIDMDNIRKKVLELPGVNGVHDLHAWTMDGLYNVMTLHLIVPPGMSQEQILQLKTQVRRELGEENIQHVTIETETDPDNCAYKNC